MNHDEIAAALRQAQMTGVPIAPIGAALPAGDVDAAYRIQIINTDLAVAAGRRIVGRKIGLTNPVVQQQLGVDQPDFGTLFDDMAFRTGDTIPARRVLQPRVEAEMAFVLGADLTDPDVDERMVRRAVAGVTASLEIVGSRIADWKITITDTIADNASAGAYVLGNETVAITDLDLTGASMRLMRNGDEVSSGVGSACLGSPLLAATWLARELCRRGRPLRDGEVILTGALGPMVPASPGDAFAASIDGLGTVSCTFA